jgi:predicted MFS family arabinose efflux permease
VRLRLLTSGATSRVTLGVGFTQIVGWGTTYLMPSVLGRHIQDSLNMPAEAVFGGVTVMAAVAAVCAPRVGRFVDRHGARLVMTTGSAVYALALALLSQAEGTASWLGGWVLIGLASALALSTPASIALVQVAGPGARQAIAMLTIIGGLSSTIFWPLTGVIDAAIGWRATLLLFAGMHLFACLPIHLLILPRKPPVHPTTTGAAAAGGGVAPDDQRRVFLLLSLSLSVGAFVFAGVQLQMIEMLRGLGHSPASALLLASMIGPAQVGIRVFELLFGHRYSIMRSAVIGSLLLPVGLGLAMMAGDLFVVALVVVLAYGFSNGLKAVQRSTLPLALFGRAQFGQYAGRLALPQGILSAVSPPILASVLTQFGIQTALLLALVMAAISLAAMIALARRTRHIR